MENQPTAANTGCETVRTVEERGAGKKMKNRGSAASISRAAAAAASTDQENKRAAPEERH